MKRIKINRINLKKYWYYYILFILLFILFIALFFIETNSGPTNLDEEHATIHDRYELKIGVLAKDGVEPCLEQWESTAKYLTENIDDHGFSIVPLKFEVVNIAIVSGEIDFLLVNPAMYVAQEVTHNFSSIATLKNLVDGEVMTKFAGVVFTKKDNDKINSFDDLKGTSLAAVNKDSLGGWLMAYYELLMHDIDPYDMFSKIDFLGEHDNVVYAVLDGTYDVGTIRSDTLERMSNRNLINIDDIKVLNDHLDPTFPVLHSTASFPSWPMAKTNHISEELGLEVAIALINMPADSQAAIDSKSAGWTISRNYQSVHTLLQKLQIFPYENFGQVTLIYLLIEYRWVFIILTFIVICLIALSLRMSILKDRLQEDVKERIIIEDKLEKAKEVAEASNKNLENTIEALTHPFYVIDANTYEVKMANSAAKRQGNGKEITTCYRLTHRRDTPCISLEHPCPLAEVKKTKNPYVVEHIHFNNNDEPRIVEVHGYPIFDDKGEMIQMIEYSLDITEKKQTEEAIRISEERLIVSSTSANIGLWDFFPKEKRLITNRVYITQLQYDPAIMRETNDEWSEVRGGSEAWFELLHPDDKERTTNYLNEYLAGRISEYRIEFRLRCKDGSYKWMRAQGQGTETDENGQMVRLHGVHIDITESKLIAESLEKSEQEQREMLENSPIGVLITVDGTFRMTNNVFRKEYGYEIGNKAIDLYVHPQERAKLLEVIEKEGIVRDYEVQIYGINKEIHNVLFSVMPTVFHGEKGILGWVVDITDRMEQEAKIKNALDKVETLYESSLALRSTMGLNEVLKTILNSLKEVVPFDSATVEEVDGDILRIIHYKGNSFPDEIIGVEFPLINGTIFDKAVHDKVPIIIPDVRKEDGFYDMSEGKKVRSFMGVPLVINDEIIGLLTIDSHKLNSYNQELADLANAFATQAAIALNNARNFKELKIAKEAAEAAAKAKGDFLANMSHEIRTPMNAVIGLNSLLERTELKSKQKDYVTKIGRSAKNLLKIINDILDFSKIESGKLAIEQIYFNLEDMLENLSVVLALKAYERGIELVISKDKEVPIDLIGDSLRIGQVLLNLTNNAIKFTDNGEVIIKVTNIEETDKDVLLKFSVKDSGIGMTEEQVSKLFKAFTQADVSTTRKYGGTGLGLSISKNLVNLMGSNIDVDSVYGEGSEFYFTLRLEKSETKMRKNDIIPTFLMDLKVLVIEDNEYAREVLNNYLEDFSINPVLVASGEEAISEIKSNDSHYDLILTDWKMPNMNGFETWRQIKNTLGNKPLPKIILITAYGKEELFKQAKNEGFSDLLTKPIYQSTLFDSIIKVFSDEVETDEHSVRDWDYPDGFDEIRGAKILLVEDNEVNQQVASETLVIEGFWVEIADNGQIAVDKIANGNKYDIILMDLQMPVLDGFKASEKIRKILITDDMPIIALSADAMSGTRENVLDVGMNDYVSKPIDKTDLFSVMVKWIKPGERKRNVVNLDTEFVISKEIMDEKLLNIDVQDGTNRVTGNLNLYIGILKKFRKNNAEFINMLNQYINEDKKEESKRLVHTIKGVSGNIGAKTLNYLVKNLEDILKSENRSNDMLNDEIDNVSKELNIIFAQIDNLLDYIDENSDNDVNDVSIDKQEILKKLEILENTLEEYDTKAQALHEDLVKYMLVFGVNVEYEKLGDCIVNYDFDTALVICGEIIEKIK